LAWLIKDEPKISDMAVEKKDDLRIKNKLKLGFVTRL